MIIKKFKNGNINIKGYGDTISEIESLDDFVCLLCNSISLDFSYAGTVSTNTYGAYELHNANTDKMYIINYDMYKDFVSSLVVKLQGCSYDKSDYENTDIYEYLNQFMLLLRPSDQVGENKGIKSLTTINNFIDLARSGKGGIL